MPGVIAHNLFHRVGDLRTGVDVLRDVSIEAPAGTVTAIVGPAGSGKTSLLHLLAGLDRPTAGSVTLDERNLRGLDDIELTRLRRDRIGLLLPAASVLPTITVRENVALPLLIARRPVAAEAVDALLERVGLADRADDLPSQLTAAERQRVALARALVGSPSLLLADEPCGDMDCRGGRVPPAAAARDRARGRRRPSCCSRATSTTPPARPTGSSRSTRVASIAARRVARRLASDSPASERRIRGRMAPSKHGGQEMGVLDDKVAIVTGSARGIGRATAELLTEHGAKVLINDLDGDVAEQTASRDRGETVVYGGDLTKDGAPDALVQTAIDAWGKLDIIVNNAGYTIDAPIHKMTDDAFQRMLDIHTIVPFRVIRAAAPHLREPAKEEREEGREVFRKIVNVSSISGTMGNAGQANYSAGKAAVVGLTKTLAKEWGQFKINVNAVAFGYIETRLTASKDESNMMEIGGEKVQLGIPDQMRGMASMLIPLGRPGTPEEAAGGVFFLCSPWSNYVHGQVLNITGGQFTGMTT